LNKVTIFSHNQHARFWISQSTTALKNVQRSRGVSDHKFGSSQPVHLAYQPPANSTFLSEQTSHQQPASGTFLSEQTSTSHPSPAKRTG
jgi:hypothetical protein